MVALSLFRVKEGGEGPPIYKSEVDITLHIITPLDGFVTPPPSFPVPAVAPRPPATWPLSHRRAPQRCRAPRGRRHLGLGAAAGVETTRVCW
jgi:hypothetical protein